MAKAIEPSQKKKFVKSGVFQAELGEMLKRELAEEGYSGIKLRESHKKTEIIINATKTQNVIGEGSKRIRELTSLIEKRFNYAPGTLELYADKVPVRGLSSVAQAEALKFRLMGGMPVRNVLKLITESGARGAEVIVSGKIKGQRAKAMKFCDGLMIHSGEPVKYYIDKAVRHVLLPQGILGIKVKIMLSHDPSGKAGCPFHLPDHVIISTPKEEILAGDPYSEDQNLKN